MKDLEKTAKDLTVQTDIYTEVAKFNDKLHETPDPKNIQINEKANNSKYIPISFLEMKLDDMFLGQWQTENFKTTPIANEIVGSIELVVLHPVSKIWLHRIGAGAVMIQQKKGSELMDMNAKYKNTLTKDYPHLKAECFRNACLSLGKSFGRDLNREFESQYIPEFISEDETKLQTIIDEFTDKAELKSKSESLVNTWKDKISENKIKNMVNERYRKL